MTSPEQTDCQPTLDNIRSLISGMAPEPVEIEVVAYGPGLAFNKKDSVHAAETQKLESPHVHFIACGNAMRKHIWKRQTWLPQKQGWSDIKAGP